MPTSHAHLTFLLARSPRLSPFINVFYLVGVYAQCPSLMPIPMLFFGVLYRGDARRFGSGSRACLNV